MAKTKRTAKRPSKSRSVVIAVKVDKFAITASVTNEDGSELSILDFMNGSCALFVELAKKANVSPQSLLKKYLGTQPEASLLDKKDFN